jgi:hypothetical protein
VATTAGALIFCIVVAANAAAPGSATAPAVGPILSGLSAPVLDYPSAANPPTIGISIGSDWQTGNTLKLDRSQDATFATGVSTLSHTIVDADTVPGATITMSIPSLTGTPWYFRAEGSGAGDSSSSIVAWGDSVAPTITTSATQSVIETLPLAVTLAATDTGGVPALVSNGTSPGWYIDSGADQLQYEVAIVAGVPTLRWYNNSSQATATPLDAGANNVYDVVVGAIDYAGNKATKAIATTVNAADLTPDAFTFTSITGAALSANRNSIETITISGLEPNFDVAFSVSGCLYKKNNGSKFIGAPGVVRNGDTLQLQVATSAFYETPTVGSVTVGTYTTTFTVTTLQDPANVSWAPESPPPAQNIAFGASTALFSSINFGIGMGVVFVASFGRDISGVTVEGSAATLVSKSSSASSNSSIWRINVTSAGAKNVVVTGTSSLDFVAIATGTMTPSSQTPSSVATPKAYGYTNDPQALASITVPSNGIALCALMSENVSTSGISWTTGTQETNITTGADSNGIRLTTARLRTTGAFSLTGLSFAGTAMAAAAWGP